MGISRKMNLDKLSWSPGHTLFLQCNSIIKLSNKSVIFYMTKSFGTRMIYCLQLRSSSKIMGHAKNQTEILITGRETMHFRMPKYGHIYPYMPYGHAKYLNISIPGCFFGLIFCIPPYNKPNKLVTHKVEISGRQAGRQVGGQVGRQVGRYVGRQVGRQLGRWIGGQVRRQVGMQVGSLPVS